MGERRCIHNVVESKPCQKCDDMDRQHPDVKRIAALEAEVAKYHLLRDAVNADSGDCTPECNADGHAEDCTWFDAADVIVRLKAEVADLRALLEEVETLIVWSKHHNDSTRDLRRRLAKALGRKEET